MSEETLFRGSSASVINLGTFLVCGLVAAISLVLGFIVPPPFSLALLAPALLAMSYAAYRWLVIRCRVYEVTTERIRITTGIFTRRTDELELYRVRDTTLVQPLLLRLFALGNIDITTTDASTPAVRLEAIREARALREEMRKSVEVCRDRKRVRLAELD
jgi:uncharacterized membrane protein YdbT with pleckstrin-like domain